MDVIGRSKRLITSESLREQPFSELAPPGQFNRTIDCESVSLKSFTLA